jgi:hypothetical protein
MPVIPVYLSGRKLWQFDLFIGGGIEHVNLGKAILIRREGEMLAVFRDLKSINVPIDIGRKRRHLLRRQIHICQAMKF